MKLSVLCITKDRPEFLPWLKWDLEKQTYDGELEVIVVDSSLQPNKTWFEREMPYAKLIELDHAKVCGHARQAALGVRGALRGAQVGAGRRRAYRSGGGYTQFDRAGGPV